jgi:hypothetical protein
MKVAERRKWAKRVLSQFEKAAQGINGIVFLAGKRYREFIIGPLKHKDINVSVPMIGLGIGKQLAWLKQHSLTKRPQRPSEKKPIARRHKLDHCHSSARGTSLARSALRSA